MSFVPHYKQYPVAGEAKDKNFVRKKTCVLKSYRNISQNIDVFKIEATEGFEIDIFSNSPFFISNIIFSIQDFYDNSDPSKNIKTLGSGFSPIIKIPDRSGKIFLTNDLYVSCFPSQTISWIIFK